MFFGDCDPTVRDVVDGSQASKECNKGSNVADENHRISFQTNAHTIQVFVDHHCFKVSPGGMELIDVRSSNIRWRHGKIDEIWRLPGNTKQIRVHRNAKGGKGYVECIPWKMTDYVSPAVKGHVVKLLYGSAVTGVCSIGYAAYCWFAG